MLGKSALVVLNEQHQLLQEQINLLNKNFGHWEVFPVPKNGWTLSEMVETWKVLRNSGDTVVFASPVPYLILRLGVDIGESQKWNVYLFHNDRREKKELPNGTVIYTVAKEGWQLV